MKEAPFAILDSFSRGSRVSRFMLLERKNGAILLVCVIAGIFLHFVNLLACRCRSFQSR